MSERNYLALAKRILNYGETRTDRTGTGTKSIFGASLEWDISDGEVPLLMTKSVAWEKALLELLWMSRGETNLSGLGRAKNIWSPWAGEDGELGPVYGKQWRDFGGIDQLDRTVKLLKRTPDTRRAVMSNWNPPELSDMALEPCPVLFQFSRRGDNYEFLELSVYQRSADLFLGVPFDLFEFAVMAQLVAREVGVYATRLIWNAGDVHIYSDHSRQMLWQLGRPLEAQKPVLEILPGAPGLFDQKLALKDFRLWDYDPYPAISGKVSV